MSGLEGLAANSFAVSPLGVQLKFFPGTSAPKHLRYVSNHIVDMWAGRAKRQLGCMFAPRHGKSWLCTLATALFALIQNPGEETHVGICSYSDDLAQAFARTLKDTITANAPILGWDVRSDSRSVERFNLTTGATAWPEGP
jgi:hypothetical protein